MTPIYFPFTYVSFASCCSLLSCFSKIAAYQANEKIMPEDMKSLVEKDLIEVRIPVKGDGNKLRALLKDYRSWADVHQGGDMTFFKSRAKNIPFFDDASISKIKDDIKKATISSRSSLNKGNAINDHIFSARLFLTIAQEYDLSEADISRQMDIIEKKEKDVFDGLKGESENLDGLLFQQKQKTSRDYGDYLTVERISAWATLFFEERIGSGVFVTSSRAVLENLLERSDDAINIASFCLGHACSDKSDQIEKFKMQLLKLFYDLSIEEKYPTEFNLQAVPSGIKAFKTISLSAYLIPGENPVKYFSRFVRDDELPFKDINCSPYKSTVICLVE